MSCTFSTSPVLFVWKQYNPSSLSLSLSFLLTCTQTPSASPPFHLPESSLPASHIQFMHIGNTQHLILLKITKKDIKQTDTLKKRWKKKSLGNVEPLCVSTKMVRKSRLQMLHETVATIGCELLQTAITCGETSTPTHLKRDWTNTAGQEGKKRELLKISVCALLIFSC